jgi:hypothetical protein
MNIWLIFKENWNTVNELKRKLTHFNEEIKLFSKEIGDLENGMLSIAFIV